MNKIPLLELQCYELAMPYRTGKEEEERSGSDSLTLRGKWRTMFLTKNKPMTEPWKDPRGESLQILFLFFENIFFLILFYF